jgi:hypothetical protein
MESITKRGAAPLRMQRTPGTQVLDNTGEWVHSCRIQL